MEWLMFLVLILGTFLLTVFLGLPVAFSFLFTSMVFMFALMGGISGLQQFVLTLNTSLLNFNLTTIVFYILMAEFVFQSGMAIKAMDVISRWIGAIPGRLSIVTMLAGGLFASLSGSTIANTAMFGRMMLPEMEKQRYHPSMSAGAIMGSGALAMVIPPSGLAIILATLANISIGKMLMASILPGILLLVLFLGYVVVRSFLNPRLAPRPAREEGQRDSFARLITISLRDLFPLLLLIFTVLGLVFLGVASPSEAAALGAFIALVLVVAYGQLTLPLLRDVLLQTIRVGVMIFAIMAGSTAFSQILSYSGAASGLLQMVSQSELTAVGLMIGLLLVSLLMGTFMEQAAIMMILLPICMPIIKEFSIDPFWFAVMFLITLEVGQLSPPVGTSLFTMKGVAPHMPTKEIYKAAVPFIILNVAAIALIFILPELATYLPSEMRR